MLKYKKIREEDKGVGKIQTLGGKQDFISSDLDDMNTITNRYPIIDSNTKDALSKHVDDEDKSDVAIHDGSQNRNMTIIPKWEFGFTSNFN